MSRMDSWTPHTYPVQERPVQASPVQPPSAAALSAQEHAVQPPTGTPPVRSTQEQWHPPHPSSQPTLEEDKFFEAEEKPKITMPQMPRNIRAVKDGANFKPQGRTIIIALDGTGDQFDADNSNIVHFVSCLKKANPNQITYYQSGIGTYDGGGLSNGVNAAFDMAVGSGLGVHIRDAYKFLMQTYQENDKICLFGFSRGAYTARCLGGMLHKVGLLPAHNVSQVPFAYEFYKDDSDNGWEMSAEFKKTFCMDIDVYFIGVFDSVASVGFIPRRLPLSATPTNKARYFRHAMALDEHRAKFKVCRFQRKRKIGGKGSKWETVAEAHDEKPNIHEQPNSLVRRFSPGLGVLEKENDLLNGDENPNAMKKQEKRREESWETDVLEVWFTGCHADVGGGAVKNTERHKLAQIPLRWMIRQCFECDTGIIFKAHRLAEEGIDVHTLWPHYTALQIPRVEPPPHLMEKYENGAVPPIEKRSSVLEPVKKEEPHGFQNIRLWKDSERQALAEHWLPEQVEDYFDALTKINDQLVESKGWWILEVWPIKMRFQPKDSDEWLKKVTVNLGRYRACQEHAPNLHWTVQARQDAQGYLPRTRRDRKSEWKVVV